jgi:hypothetical protein
MKSLDHFLLHDFESLTHASLMASSGQHGVEGRSMTATFAFVGDQVLFLWLGPGIFFDGPPDIAWDKRT